MQIIIKDLSNIPICIGMVKSMSISQEEGIIYVLHPLHVFNGKEGDTYGK